MKKEKRVRANGSAAKSKKKAEKTAAFLARHAREARKLAGVHPFGPREETTDVNFARMLIDDTFQECAKKQWCDGVSVLFTLACCMKHHPSLQTEVEAIERLNEAHNALIVLSNRVAAKDGSELTATGAEKWLGRRIDEMDARHVTLEGVNYELRNVDLLFLDDPRTEELARMIGRMRWAYQTLRELHAHLAKN